MSVTLDVYLRDQVIRGELAIDGNRPLDQFNGALESHVLLEDACVQSLYVDGPPAALGAVRIQKERILLAIPCDGPPTVARQLRGVWVPKTGVRLMIGLEGLTIIGTFHVRNPEHASLDRIMRAAEGRAFLPVTDARVRWLHRPDWSVEAPSIFVAHVAIGYICLIPPTAAQAADAKAASTEDLAGRPDRRGDASLASRLRAVAATQP